jgi:hypothetical protein
MRKIILILSLLIILVFTSCQKREQIRVRCVYGHDIVEYYDGDKLKTAFIGYTNYIVVLDADKPDELTIIEKKEGKTIQTSNNE